MNHAKRLSGPLRTTLILLGAITLAAAPATARAANITVNTLSDEATSGDGRCSLREAINNANSATDTTGGDCAPGTSGEDTIKFGVKGTITLTSSLPAIVQTLTIDGGGRIVINGAFFQVLVVNSGATLVVDNLTIENGAASFGGGIDDEGGTLTVSNSNFFDNIAASVGGAIDDEGGTLTVSNSTFSGNLARSCGGAISNTGPMTVTSSVFSGNNLRPVGGMGEGGAICGGGTIINSIFSGNSTGGEPGPGPHAGGAIFGSVPLTISNSVFSGNFVRDGFGGAISGGGTVTNSTFAGNTATSGMGGAIAGGGTVTNSTFFDNLASFGGGAIVGSAMVTNSTFFGNSAALNGGAILGGATVTNSILAGSSFGGNCGGFVPVINGGNNISDDDTCSFGSATAANGATIGDNVDPLLDPNGLQNNGGPTKTIALQSTSPAIDAIPAASCPATDQRGVPRPDNFETACDIGSYEFFEFAGTPGQSGCASQSIAALSEQFGSLTAAASALGFPNAHTLRAAIRAFCRG